MVAGGWLEEMRSGAGDPVGIEEGSEFISNMGDWVSDGRS
jgi:hypothetical protein